MVERALPFFMVLHSEGIHVADRKASPKCRRQAAEIAQKKREAGLKESLHGNTAPSCAFPTSSKDTIRWRPLLLGWRPSLLGTRSYY